MWPFHASSPLSTPKLPGSHPGAGVIRLPVDYGPQKIDRRRQPMEQDKASRLRDTGRAVPANVAAIWWMETILL